jgi:hypothetical protein
LCTEIAPILLGETWNTRSGDTTGSGAAEIDASAARQVPRWSS